MAAATRRSLGLAGAQPRLCIQNPEGSATPRGGGVPLETRWGSQGQAAEVILCSGNFPTSTHCPDSPGGLEGSELGGD